MRLATLPERGIMAKKSGTKKKKATKKTAKKKGGTGIC